MQESNADENLSGYLLKTSHYVLGCSTTVPISSRSVGATYLFLTRPLLYLSNCGLVVGTFNKFGGGNGTLALQTYYIVRTSAY